MHLFRNYLETDSFPLPHFHCLLYFKSPALSPSHPLSSSLLFVPLQGIEVKTEAATQVEEDLEEDVGMRTLGGTLDLASISYEALVEKGAMGVDTSENPYSYRGAEGEQLGEEVEGQSEGEIRIIRIAVVIIRNHYLQRVSMVLGLNHACVFQ